jgi:hypothetical protein
VKVAVSALALAVTCARWVRLPDVTVTDMNVISAALSVIVRDGAFICTAIVSRPRNVAVLRSGANQSV